MYGELDARDIPAGGRLHHLYRSLLQVNLDVQHGNCDAPALYLLFSVNLRHRRYFSAFFYLRV